MDLKFSLPIITAKSYGFRKMAFLINLLIFSFKILDLKQIKVT